MEYPGYGLYKDLQASEEQLFSDIETVYDYASNHLDFGEDKIFVIGRSIGSGPAMHLACRVKLGGAILISPFKSLKSVVKGFLFGSMTQMLVKERFDNLSRIAHLKCPASLIHGDQDDLIPLEHSKELAGNLPFDFKKHLEAKQA